MLSVTRYGSPLALHSGTQPVFVLSSGQGFFTADGKPAWGPYKGFKGTNSSILSAENGVLLSYQPAGIFKLKCPAQPGGTEPIESIKSVRNDEEPAKRAATDGKKHMDPHTIASPLIVEGLAYCLSDKGLLRVFDVQAGVALYDQELPLKPYLAYVSHPGCAASPAWAGDRIYILDNQGGTVVIKPGRQFEQLALNQLECPPRTEHNDKGAHNEQTVSNPWFEGSRIFIRGQEYLYCIEESRKQ